LLGIVLKNNRGFTLIETVVIVAVISILVTIAAPSFVNTIENTKARKVTDFIVQLVNYAKSEALSKNKDIYMTINSGSICLSSTAAYACDVRQDPIQIGASVVILDADANQEIIFNSVYGLPDTSATISVTTSSRTKSIAMNILGFIVVN
jgi:type IV fimbrial biogenesis protein FimT